MSSVMLMEWFPLDKGQFSPACSAASQRSSGILTKGILLMDKESCIFPPVTSSSAEINQQQLLWGVAQFLTTTTLAFFDYQKCQLAYHNQVTTPTDTGVVQCRTTSSSTLAGHREQEYVPRVKTPVIVREAPRFGGSGVMCTEFALILAWSPGWPKGRKSRTVNDNY